MDSQYSLTDMEIILREQSEASVEDEYSSYVTGLVNHAPVNIVNYWKVCSIASVLCHCSFLICPTGGHGLFANSGISSAL